ncbi:DUF4407 domain-containing protein [Dactylosporangium sp. McL0621]|uniref:DUF4407 domain-containing protein n=1 Tax=Dactylosporangium sp. McL0621 TaxID=3415678 RepID=UPI003CE7B82C
MTETVLIRPQTDDDTVEIKREPYRPSRPARMGPGRVLRHIAGIDETILDWAPEERHRYTRLGAIVLNTGLMAALSMYVLLGSHQISPLILVPAALTWGYIVLSFDRWLVSNTHGTGGMGTGTFIARTAISVLMGLVVAEPLLLWMFGTDIHTQINQTRAESIETYESTLKRCNPLDGEAPKDAAGCSKEFTLNVPGAPRPLLDAKAAAERERDKAKTDIAAIDTEINRREDLARQECNGTKGNGLSGRVGEGPNCRQLRGETQQYKASSGRADRQDELDAANTKISGIDVQLAAASQTYSQNVTAAIKQRVEQKKADMDRPGLLDQEKALTELGGQNFFVLFQSNLVRLLLMVLDCLPVLVKKMTRPTTYDGLLSRQLTVDNRLHEKTLKNRSEREVGDLEVQIQQNEHNVRVRKERIEEQGRDAEADRQTNIDAQIEELARRLRGDA